MADGHQNCNTRKLRGTVSLRNESKARVVAYTVNPSTWEQRPVDLRLRPAWSTNLQNSQSCYREKPCLKKKKRYLRIGASIHVAG